MPWVRIDDQFPQHPKVAKVGPLGMALQVAGLCYCNRYLTDGFVPVAVARTLLDFTGIGIRMWANELFGGGEDATAKLIIQDLIDAGIWEETEGGYHIHDFEDYQPSKAEVLAEKAKKVAAGQAGGQASAQARAQARAQAKSKPVPNPNPNPNPNPTPMRREETVAPLPHTQDLGKGEEDDREDDRTVWPEWYATLFAIPGFKVPLTKAQAWLEGKAVAQAMAEQTAYALKSKWPGPKGKEYKDPWATFQHWVVRLPLQNGANANGTIRPSIPSMEELEARSREKWGDPATRKQAN